MIWRRGPLTGKPLSSNTLILLTTLWITLLGNVAFFSRVLQAYTLDGSHLLPLLSLPLVVAAVTALSLSLVCIGRLTRPLLILLLLSAVAAYFMDSYGVILDRDMLENALQTNAAEAGDLLDIKMLAYLLVLGVLPALWIGRRPLLWRGWRRELMARLRLMALLLLCLIAPVLAFGGFYASFVRQHKNVRFYVNPTFYVYSLARLARAVLLPAGNRMLAVVGADARIPAGDEERELVILVLGETARADHFSLNGYGRDTNPQLRARGAISFDNFWACGTSTAAALPCMFDVANEGGNVRENLLDVLQHAGVHVGWFDNNSDSKGVALRVPYQSFKTPDVNPRCDEECRDEGMLGAVQAFIDSHPTGDIFIVLHQMGNHGPAYYKRYPKDFEKFTPVCCSSDLSRCTTEEIGNAYDNAVLYTDHFLGQVIGLLQGNSQSFEAGMLYVSDHGESLGEGGIYLHGLPPAVAPAAQLHVPAVMWFADSFDAIDREKLRDMRSARLSHANLFHTALGLLEIRSAAYRADLDILHCCRKPEH